MNGREMARRYRDRMSAKKELAPEDSDKINKMLASVEPCVYEYETYGPCDMPRHVHEIVDYGHEFVGKND